MKRCILCGHPVSLGDRHARYSCPPVPGERGESRRRKRLRAKRRKQSAEDSFDQRGMPVAFIRDDKGKIKGVKHVLTKK